MGIKAAPCHAGKKEACPRSRNCDLGNRCKKYRKWLEEYRKGR